jgi:FkbM family methyltransferase
MPIKQILKSIVPKFLWTRLRILRIRYTRAGFQPRIVRHRYGAFDLEIELVDPMGEGWYDSDRAEPAEISFLRERRLKPGAKVFDIGAHQCVIALLLARTVGPQGAVIAVEANPLNCQAGERNLSLNGVTNCQVLHAAGAARAGTLTFSLAPNGQVDDGSGEWGRMDVRAVSVDDLSSEHGAPDVLFIDVEGFECELLQGAQQTLASRPDCFVEVHVGAGLEKFGGSIDKVLSLFPQGYEFYAAQPEKTFAPLDRRSELLKDRFFLIATCPARLPSRDSYAAPSGIRA